MNVFEYLKIFIISSYNQLWIMMLIYFHFHFFLESLNEILRWIFSLNWHLYINRRNVLFHHIWNIFFHHTFFNDLLLRICPDSSWRCDLVGCNYNIDHFFDLHDPVQSFYLDHYKDGLDHSLHLYPLCLYHLGYNFFYLCYHYFYFCFSLYLLPDLCLHLLMGLRNVLIWLVALSKYHFQIHHVYAFHE